MTETAPSRRSRLTEVPSASLEQQRTGLGFVWRLWAVVAVFSLVVLVRSAQLGIPLRDPEGQYFSDRIIKALVILLILAVAEAVVRALRSDRSWRGLGRTLRERWTAGRVALVVTGLLAYHIVYVEYRNLKSWNAFNALRDDDLLALDRALFFGHSPAELLHALVGETYAAEVLAAVYTSFTWLVYLSLVGSLVLIPRVRRAYVFLAAAMWTWILGTLSYYLLPSLGPFAITPSEFAGLSPTSISESQPGLWSTAPGCWPTRRRPTRSPASAPSRACTSASPAWCC